jgi:DNA-binding transcriptional MocR family regulator
MNTMWTPDLTQFPGPKFLALARALRDAIRQGLLEPGARLPPVRDLAFALGITPGTVARAYQVATQEGLLSATVGRGTYVAAAAPRLGPTQSLAIERLPPTRADEIDLRSPTLPDVGQDRAVAQVFAKMAQDLQADWLSYPTQRDEGRLRSALHGWLADVMLGPTTPDDITLTYGGQNAVLLVLLCCLRGNRPVVLTEELAYPGFRHAARLARADVIGVEIDDQGIIPDALEAACRKHGPQVLCLTPGAQNPTSARMGLDRRQAIVAIARKFDLQVIEDYCYAAGNTDLPALRALAPERCWYVGGWAKSISAALRFGYIVCPTDMGVAGRLTAQHAFFALSRAVSDAALELITSGAASEISRNVQAKLVESSLLMVNHLGMQELAWQKGLPFLWLRLPSGWRASTFVMAAQAEGILVRSADEFALVHAHTPNAVRLSINGRVPQARLAAAMDSLARLLARPPGEPCV